MITNSLRWPGACCVIAAMRAAVLVLLVVSGCSLYFEHSSDPPPPPVDASVSVDAPGFPFPDAPPRPPADAPGGGPTWPPDPNGLMARCEDGRLYSTTVVSFGEQEPAHGAGRRFGLCGGACRSAAVLCSDAGCTNAFAALCEAPISVGATCPLEGMACQGSAAIDCPETTACSVPVEGSTCTCVDRTYRCEQTTPAAATQAAIVGKWSGTVTTPGFVEPYPVTLWIYPDGSYWPSCELPFCSAFYYGGDGPSQSRKITVLSTTDHIGSWADIAIDFDLGITNHGTLTALVVDATTLRFTFSPSWSDCGMPFDFALTRN